MAKKSKGSGLGANSIGYFDFARGLGILMVVCGHMVPHMIAVTEANYDSFRVSSILGGGYMAFFLMVSGYGFFSRKPSKCVKLQAKMLLVPYAVTAGMIILAKLALAILKSRSFLEYGGEFIPTFLLVLNRGYKGTIFGLPVNNVTAMWFLWALFGGWCIYNQISRIKEKKWIPYLVLLCVVVGMMMVYFQQFWFYLIPHMLQAVGFIYLGHQVRERDLLNRKLSPVVWILAVVFVVISCKFGYVDIFDCHWDLNIIDYVGIASAGFLLMKAFSLLASRNPENVFYRFVSLVGTHTLDLLCIQSFAEKVIPWTRGVGFFTDHPVQGIVVFTACDLIFMFVAFQMVAFVKKIMKAKRKKKKHRKLDIVR